MRSRQRNLRDQTIVITGASSGIGLATARLAAERGARVLLTSRNEQDLRRAVAEITEAGGRAAHIVADVADPQSVERVAVEAVQKFGGFDTWVNNAGVSIYGKLMEMPLEDKRRLFDVNFWGVVHGCRAAVPHFRRHGGTIINIGSVVSDLAMPLQGIYSASKQAVKGYTDALRMELEEEGAPIAVTLIKPAATDTPHPRHARNYMEREPALPPPLYAPEVVASAILRCAERPVREVTVGGGGRAMTVVGALTPARTRGDSLYEPQADGVASGGNPGHVMRSSAYTAMKLGGAARLIPVVVGAALGFAMLRNRSL
ncbi:MAG: SDR family oxidoreductase [Vicinamibacterales bacterium]